MSFNLKFVKLMYDILNHTFHYLKYDILIFLIIAMENKI